MLKSKFCILSLTGFLFITISSIAQESQKVNIVAKIRAIKQDNMVNINAKAINNTNNNFEILNYTLLVVKKDIKGNLSKSQQSGKFSILVNQSKILSKLQLNINDKGNIKVYLYIRKGKKLLSKDLLEITLIDKKYSTEKIEEENIELSGLIVENVMTKLGKDFYDYFTQIIQLNGLKYHFIILVEEKPSIGGRNSEVRIKIKDEIVYQFNTQPNDEYLNKKALEANKRIYKYNIKQKLLHKKNRIY